MKGAANIIFLMVVLLLLAFVLFSLSGVAQRLIELVVPRDLIEFLLPDLPDELPGGIPDTIDFTGDPYDTTSTEVACAIAQAIRRDFHDNKYGNRTAELDPEKFPQKIDVIDTDRFVIDMGKFNISINPNKPDYPQIREYWNYGDLGARAKNRLEQECNERKDDGHDFRPCSTPYLDEECISGILGGLKYEVDKPLPLCTKLEGGSQIVYGEQKLDFGNDKCAAADGTDNCGDLCPGGDKIYKWYAPTEKQVYALDRLLANNGFPPKECEGTACEPDYVWILEWNNKEKYWEIIITYLPTNADYVKEFGPEDMIATVAPRLAGRNVGRPLVAGDGKPQGRSLTAGAFNSSLRTVWDMTVQPDKNVHLVDFMNAFTNSLGDGWGWGADLEECPDEATCLVPRRTGGKDDDLETITWSQGGVAAEDNSNWVLKIDQSVSCSSIKKALHTVHLRSMVLHDYLKADHKYRIVLRWWSVNWEGDVASTERECSGWIHLTACALCFATQEDPCNTYFVWQDNCQTIFGPKNFAYFNYKNYIRYQDLRMIIVDLGRAGGEGEAGEGGETVEG